MNHIPRSEGCVKVYADSLRKTIRLLTFPSQLEGFTMETSTSNPSTCSVRYMNK
jgi:hypothetical protein